MQTPSFSRVRSAFTLVELLVVVAIIIVLVTLIVPPITSLMGSYALTSSSRDMVGQLVLGRQTALAKGTPVQVRVYELPAYNASLTATPSVYRGIECFVEGPAVVNSGSTTVPLTPVTKPIIFNNLVTVLNDATRSTLLTLTPTAAVSTDPSLPGYKLNYQYINFHFKPGSQTDLTTAANTLALVLQNAPLTANGFPSNFFLLKINAFNGTMQSYQP